MLEHITTRKATENDLNKICNSHVSALKEIGVKSVPSNEDLTKYVSENMNAFYLAESDGNIVGQAALIPSHFIQYITHNGVKITKFDKFLCDIYVSPEHRNNKIGSELIGWIENDVNGFDMTNIYSCGESESGRGFLEKNGYINRGKECRSCDAWNDDCSNVPMYTKHIK